MRRSTSAHSSSVKTSARSRYSSRPSAQGGAKRSASCSGVGRALSRMRASCSEPVDIAAQPLLQADARLVAELVPRPGDVGDLVSGVALGEVFDDLAFAASDSTNGLREREYARRD